MPDNMHYPYGPSWAAEPYFGQTGVTHAVGEAAHHVLNDNRTNGAQNAAGFNSVLAGQRDLMGDVRDVVHGANRDISGGQRDILGELCDVQGDICKDGGQTRDRLATESRFIGESLANIRRETTKDHCDIQADIKDSLSTLRRDICEVDHNVSKEACQTREVVKDQVKDVLMGQATIRKEMVEQHCALSKEIIGQNQATRDLLNDRTLRETERELDSEKFARLIDRVETRTDQTQGLMNQLLTALIRNNGDILGN